MGKDDKEETGFGFKDKAKAEETLRLLEQHDPNYRRLTVRGLLGRAKRVLSMTKAEDKIKNIKEAMQVFEDWLAELEKNKEKKPEKKEKKEDKDDNEKSSSNKNKKEKVKDTSDAGPVLGFKDEETANTSLKELKGRDPDYQKLAVKGLIQRAERVLTSTRDETKITNIKSAISIFNKFLDDFESLHLSKKNNSYISLGVVKTCVKLAENISDLQKSFIAAYTSADGDYKRLRSVRSDGGDTWDIVRNTALEELKEKHAEAKLFNDKDEPTPEHLEMLLWAYSPEAAKVKKVIKEDVADDDDDDDEMIGSEEDKSDEEEQLSRKRKSSADGDESPSKKKK